MVYKFPTTHQAKPKLRIKHTLDKIEAPQETIGPVNGRIPDSVQEWRLAQALWYFDLSFEFQVPVRGGRWVHGGQTVDFIVYRPFAQPVQVFGDYWHGGAYKNNKDIYNLNILQQIYGVPVIVIEEQELQSYEQAVETVRKKVL